MLSPEELRSRLALAEEEIEHGEGEDLDTVLVEADELLNQREP